ncbi:MAG: metallophosphoesterase [Promethearchaeia archaeon]
MIFLSANHITQISYARTDPSLYRNQPSVNHIDQGYINDSDNELIWFLHVTDTQDIWYDDGKIGQWRQMLNQSYREINPFLIYNTGDLVNSDYENFITGNERDQRIEEWERYNQSLYDSGMNSSIYMDVIGNHDVYGDLGNSYFLNYSMMGKELNTLQYGFNRSFSFGDYAFIGLHTAEDYGIRYPFALFGYLNTQELDWYEQELTRFQDCDRIFLMGHHPPFEIYSTRSSSGKSFFQLNEEFDVDYYFMGHGHINSFQNVNGMLAIETEKFSNEGGSYRIVTLDKNQLSTSIERVGQWPQGIITNPPRRDYLEEETWTDGEHIRVLAWDPEGVNFVEWSAFTPDGSKQIIDWENLDNISSTGPLWEGDFSKLEEKMAKNSDLESSLIKVRISGKSGENIKEILYSPTQRTPFGWYEAIPLIYISCFSLIGIAIIVTYYLRTRVPRFKKDPEQNVDKQLRNLFLLKCFIFTIIPWTLGGMFVDQVTVVFALFYVNGLGIHFNGTLLIYTGVIFFLAIIWQGFTLSYKKRYLMVGLTVWNLLFTGFYVVFYILHFPMLSWLSPGLYGMLIIDSLILRRSLNMIKKKP